MRQLGGGLLYPRPPPKSFPRELLHMGACPAAPGRARRSSSSPAVSPLGRVDTQHQRGRALRGGVRRSVKAFPPVRHTVSACTPLMEYQQLYLSMIHFKFTIVEVSSEYMGMT